MRSGRSSKAREGIAVLAGLYSFRRNYGDGTGWQDADPYDAIDKLADAYRNIADVLEAAAGKGPCLRTAFAVYEVEEL